MPESTTEPIPCERCEGWGYFPDILGQPECPDCRGKGSFEYPDPQSYGEWRMCEMSNTTACQCVEGVCFNRIHQVFLKQAIEAQQNR